MRTFPLDRFVDAAVAPFTDRQVRTGAGAAIAATGAVLVAVLFSRALSAYDDPASLLLGGVFPLALAVAVIAGGAGLIRSDIQGQGGAYILLWWAIGTVVAATTGVAIIVFQAANDVALVEPAVIVAGNAATGGLGGMVVGYAVARRLAVARQRRRERERLADEREKLALLNRIVRHDIGNDLQVVAASGEFLDGHVDEAGQAALERLQRTADEAVELTDQVRRFVQAIDDEDAERRPVSLRRVVGTQVGNARERYPAATVVAEDLPDVSVLADELLASVVHNLLSNAISHNDTDDPRVAVSAAVEGDTVRLRVADNGPGIPEQRRETLFERGNRSAASEGTGIGLYIVETLVDRYGGDVWIEANDPRGAVFVVELRRCAGEEARPEAPAQESAIRY